MKHLQGIIGAAAALWLTACSVHAAEPQTGRAVIDAISTRTSIRAYTPARIGADTIEILLRAAMCAPSARNVQPWAFVVVNERAALDRMADKLPYAKMLRTAPLAIVVCGNPEQSEKWWVQDCSAASENLLLAAHALGLGAVWTGVYPTERVDLVRDALQIPLPYQPLNVIVVGYPAQSPTPKVKWDAEKVHYNTWE